MHDIFFSILIPVYNVEKYITECLESVVNQSYPNFEVIIVIDGSSDTSATICEEYAKKDSRIKIFYQDNLGIFQTRRNLMNYAKGDYLLFIDSDDYYALNLLETINQTIIEQSCDLILFRFNRITDTGRIYTIDNDVFKHNTVITSENKHLIWGKLVSTNKFNHIWSKVIKKDIINDEDYAQYTDVYGEDVLLSLPIILRAKRIVYINTVLYNYRMSTNGLGRNFKLKYLEDSIYVRSEVLNYLKRAKYDTPLNLELFYTSFTKALTRLIRQVIANFALTLDIIDKLDQVKNNHLYQESLQYTRLSSLSLLEKYYYYLFQNRRYKVLKLIISFEYNLKIVLKKIVRK